MVQKRRKEERSYMGIRGKLRYPDLNFSNNIKLLGVPVRVSCPFILEICLQLIYMVHCPIL